MPRAKQLPVRFSAQGGDSLKALMRSIGMEGREAMQGIGATASGPATTGLNSMSAAAQNAQGQLDHIAMKAAQTAAALRNPLQAQINSLTGAFNSGNRAADTYFADQMRQMDSLRAKYNPMFAVIQRYKQQVAEITQANRMQAISEDEKAAAISRARQAALADIGVIKGRTGAIMQQSRATRMGSFRMQQMTYQINDIGVSLAGGQNPFLVIAQQGTQIAQIYGFGQGGVGGALRDVRGMLVRVATAAPIMTAVIVATGAAIAGLTYEINQTTDVAVGLGDTFKAVFQVAAGAIRSALKPAIDWIAPYFAAAWDAVVAGIKWVGNTLINSMRVAVDGIRTAVNTIPNMFRAAWFRAAEAVYEALYEMGIAVETFLTSIGQGLNSVFGTNFGVAVLPGVSSMEVNRFFASQKAAKAEAASAAAWDEFNSRSQETMNSDPMGDFFNAVRDQAIKNALDGEEDEKTGGGGGTQRDAAAELIKQLREELAVLRETDPVKKRMLEYAEQMAEATPAQAEAIRQLVIEQDRAKHGWEGIGLALKNYAEDAKRIGDDIGEALVGAFSAAEDAVAEFVKTGKLDFRDLVTSLIADMARLATRRFILGPLAGFLGNALGGISGSFTKMFDSFDGGGHTGYGPRTGGLDGKGGYLAMVPPRERIIDETKGQQVGGDRIYAPVMNVYTRDAESFRKGRAQLAADASRLMASGRRTM